MKLKRCLAFLLSAFLALYGTSVPIAAEPDVYCTSDEVAPAYEYVQKVQSLLSVSNDSAKYTSNCVGSSDVVQITVEQTLEKHWGLWIWNEVDGVSRIKTVNDSFISLSGTKSELDSGTYRLKSVFLLTNSNGKTETITVYSSEEKIS